MCYGYADGVGAGLRGIGARLGERREQGRRRAERLIAHVIPTTPPSMPASSSRYVGLMQYFPTSGYVLSAQCVAREGTLQRAVYTPYWHTNQNTQRMLIILQNTRNYTAMASISVVYLICGVWENFLVLNSHHHQPPVGQSLCGLPCDGTLLYACSLPPQSYLDQWNVEQCQLQGVLKRC